MTGVASRTKSVWFIPTPSTFLLLLALSFTILSTYEFGWMGVAFLLVIVGGALVTWYLPEFWTAALFSSGIFKEWATANIPLFAQFDFTVALSMMALLAHVLYRLRQREALTLPGLSGLLTFAVLAAYLLLSTSWSSAPGYGLSKAFSFAGFGGVLFLTASGYNRLQRIRSTFWILFVFGVATSVYTLVTLSQALSNLPKILEFYRASFLGVNPISYAQWVGVIAVVSLVLVSGVRSRPRRILVYVGSGIMILAVLAANSRGPMLSLLVSLLGLGVIQFRHTRSVRVFAWVGAIGGLMLILVSLLPSQLVSRYSDFSSSKTGEAQVQSRITVYQRLRLWQTALDLPTEGVDTALFGVGCGAFGHVYYRGDVAWWPHNIFLEVLSEGGLVGLLLLLTHWGTLLADTVDAKRKQTASAGSFQRVYIAIGVAILFLLIGAQVSGDLSHNRRLWYFLGMLVAANSAVRNESGEA